MKAYIVNNKFFLLIFMFWLIAGTISPIAMIVIVPLTLLIMRGRGMYAEILVGFLFVLVVSDSRQSFFAFADKVKDIYLLFLLVFYLIDGRKFNPRDKLVMRFLPFLVISYLCIIFSPIPLTSLQKTFSFTILLILAPNYMLESMRSRKWEFANLLLWSLLLFLAAGLVLNYSFANLTNLEGRYCGLMGNPNGIGLFAVTTLMFLILFTEFKPDLLTPRQKYFAYAVIFITLYLCGSRNAIFTGFIFLMFRVMYKLSPAIGFVLFILVIFLYQFIESNFADIVLALGLEQFFRLETLQSGSGRLIAWNFGMDEIGKSPLLGHGWGFTEDLYRKNYGYLSVLGHQGNAHNSYITFWLDTGFFGVLFYLFGLIRSFIGAAKLTRSAIPILYALGFHAFFESWLTGSLNPFTIQLLFMLTFITYAPVMDEKEEEELTEDEENADQEVEGEEDAGPEIYSN